MSGDEARVSRAAQVLWQGEGWDLPLAPWLTERDCQRFAEALEAAGLLKDEDDAAQGCDCTTLCSMGATCPGGILADLPGAGCHRVLPPGQVTP